MFSSIINNNKQMFLINIIFEILETKKIIIISEKMSRRTKNHQTKNKNNNIYKNPFLDCNSTV